MERRRRWRYWRAMVSRVQARLLDTEQPLLWILALLVGLLSGGAAVLFVKALALLHELLFGATGSAFAIDATRDVDTPLASAAAAMNPFTILTILVAGGLVVGLVNRWLGGGAPLGVAEVIEARAVRDGRLDPKKGAAATLASLLSLGVGASSGREGPAVVAGASISSLVAQGLKLSPIQTRMLLGCAVAAAVSASFNAPLAGALYALEVVLGHYAVRAFAPITIASVAGALLGRAYLGVEPAFQIDYVSFGSPAQFPAFFLLGLICAGVAMAMIWSIFLARDVIDSLRERIRAPDWTQPAIAGVALAGVAVAFPHVLSVGYHTTSAALAGALSFWACVIFAVAKTAAVAMTLGGRFGGGVFSPALMLGALTGAAFGAVAVTIFPDQAGDRQLYAIAGMGAVSGAVLGAPISTTLIVFEITGDYTIAIAVMVTTSVATVASQQVLRKSFFHLQLSRRGLDLSAGPQSFLLSRLPVRDHMRPRGDETSASDTAAWALVEQGVKLRPSDPLSHALPLFRNGRLSFLPVVEDRTAGQGDTLIGALFYVDALRAYNRALVEVHEEEHS